MFRIVDVETSKSDIARTILLTLPEWFGVPAALDAYVQEVGSLPMLAALSDAGDAVGFVALRRHFTATVEIYVVGVNRRWRRRGVGRAMLEAAGTRLRDEGVRYLTVKTLSPDHPDANYAETRRFYDAMGFLPVEVFEMLWPGGNPCLMLVKSLTGSVRGCQTDSSGKRSGTT